MSLSRAEQGDAIKAAALLYAERRSGTRSEEEIADYLKFKSVEHMYHTLSKDWGFPDW